MNRFRERARRRQHGFVLVAAGLTALVLAAAVGLAVDLGRLTVVKSEAQGWADAAALAGAALLDGTPGGLRAAGQAATDWPGRWDVGRLRFPAPQAEFADSPGGPWRAGAAAAVTARCLRVQVRLKVRLYFLPAAGVGSSGNVAVESTAAQVEKTAFSDGLFPLSVAGARPEVGHHYGWREPDNLARLGPTILGRSMLGGFQPGRLGVGDKLATGAISEASWAVLETRIGQDTDKEAADYATYLKRAAGNGRRIVVCPLTESSMGQDRVAGFGAFFLHTGRTGGEYLGAWVQGRARADARGAFAVRLVS
jgi:hypothetical protein